jgi:Rieske Fe-S protein
MRRREFLNWALGTAGALLGACILYPVLRYLRPPPESIEIGGPFRAAKKDELRADSFKIFPIGTRPGILIRLVDGEYRAFTAVCTHLGCTVQYRATHKDIWCACHNGVYDLQGRNVSGPPPRPLDRYVVQIASDAVLVDPTRVV